MKVLIAMPVLRNLTVETFQSYLGLDKPPGTGTAIQADTLVYMARNILALTAIERDYTHILWLDSDMTFPHDTLTKMIKSAEEGKEYITGLQFSRREPVEPLIAKTLTWDPKALDDTAVEYYRDYPEGIFEVAGSGFGVTMTSVKLLTDIASAFGQSPFNPLPQMGEDYSFCWRVTQLGRKMWCDSTIKCGHVGYKEYTEEDFKCKR
jgi:GT2 family glycosyltransferase